MSADPLTWLHDSGGMLEEVEPPPIAGIPGWLLALDAGQQAALMRLLDAAELMAACSQPAVVVPLSWTSCQVGVREALQGVEALRRELERGTRRGAR